MRAYQDMVFSTSLCLTGNAAQTEDISNEMVAVGHDVPLPAGGECL